MHVEAGARGEKEPVRDQGSAAPALTDHVAGVRAGAECRSQICVPLDLRRRGLALPDEFDGRPWKAAVVEFDLLRIVGGATNRLDVEIGSRPAQLVNLPDQFRSPLAGVRRWRRLLRLPRLCRLC